MKKKIIIIASALFAVLAIAAAFYAYKWKAHLEYKIPEKAGPLKILFFSPQGEEIAPTIEGFTVVFDRPMVSLTTLDEGAKSKIPISITPNLEGTFHWLGTTAFIFKPNERLPFASEFTVIIPKGTKAMDGHALEKDETFTFSTIRPAIMSVAGEKTKEYNFSWKEEKQEEVLFLDPKNPGAIRVVFNQPMDRMDAESKISMVSGDGVFPLSFEWNDEKSSVAATPKAGLDFGMPFFFSVPNGIKGAQGTLANKDQIVRKAETIGAFEFAPEEKKNDEQDNDGEDYGFYDDEKRCMRFTSPVDRENFEAQAVLTIRGLANGKVIEEIDKPKLIFKDEILHGKSPDADLNWFKTACVTDVPEHYHAGYELHLKAPIKDRYGRVLSAADFADAKIKWETKHAPSALVSVGPPRFEIHDGREPAAMIVNATNVGGIDVKAKRLSVEDWLNLKGSPPMDDAISITIAGGKEYDQARRVKIGLKQEFGGEFENPGLYFVEMKGSPLAGTSKEKYRDSTSLRKTVLITNTAMGMKKAADQVLVWMTDIANAAPRAGKAVSLYSKPSFREAYKKIAEAKTDENGVVILRLDKVLGYSDVVAAYDGGDDTSVVSDDDNSGIGPHSFSLRYGHLNSKTNYFAYIRTDRPLYRPNQEVKFSVILRGADEGKYFLPKNVKEIEWWVEDANGTDIARDKSPVSPSGMASAFFAIGGENVSRGEYKLSVKVPGKDQTFSRYFTVASFRKPEFKLSVEPGRKEYLNKDTIDARVTGKYFYGVPLSNASLEWNMTAETYAFDPKGYDGFAFADYLNLYTGEDFPEGEAQIFSDFEFDELASGERYYSESSSQTDSDKGGETERILGRPLKDERGKFIPLKDEKLEKEGELKVSHAADISKYPSSQIVTIGATATDESRQSVSAYSDVVVHKGEFYVGLKPAAWVYKEGEAGEIKVLALGWDEKPAGGKKISIDLVRRVWNYVKRQEPDKSFGWSYQPLDTIESTGTVTTGSDGMAAYKFAPNQGGDYWIVAKSRDSKGNEVKSSTDVWVSSQKLVAWDSAAKNRVDLVADKNSYKVGDVARVLVKAPVAGAKALLTIERGRVLAHKVLDLDGTSGLLDVPVTNEMVPNAYVGVMIFKGAGEGAPQFKAGYAEIKVSPEKRRLNVDISVDKESYHPKESVLVKIKTTDHEGKRVPAHVIFSVVDESILRLIDYKSPDLVKKFYYPRTLGVASADNITQFKAGDGGLAKELAKKRSKFLDTAYFNPDVATDDNGEAVVRFDLPDNLTTWVAEAIAATDDTLVGSANKSFASSMPFFLRPVLPRFLSASDEARPAVILENPSSETANGVLSINVAGAAELKDGGNLVRDLEVPAGESRKIPFDVIAKSEGKAVFSFDVKKDGGEIADEVEQTIGVFDRSSPEVVAMAGSVDDSVLESVILPDGIDKKGGEFQIELAATLMISLNEAAKYLASYPYGCAEQVSSAVLSDVIILEMINEGALPEFSKGVEFIFGDDYKLKKISAEEFLEKSIQAGIAKLYGLQENYGAFRFWPESPAPDPYITDYALYTLLRARRAGVSVDEDALQRAKGAFGAQSARSEFKEYLAKPWNRAFHEFVMSEAAHSVDAAAVSFLIENFEKDRSKWQVADMAWLLILASRAGANNARKTVLDALNSEIHPLPRGITWKGYKDRFVCGFDCQTAIILKALVEADKGHPLIENTVRQLVHSKNKDGWESTHATLWAMDALLSYMKTTEEMNPDFVARTVLDKNVIIEETFDTESKMKVFEKKISLEEIETGRQLPLEISKKGRGRLYYEATLKYNLPASISPTREEGIVIKRDFFALDDKKEERPLFKLKAGENYKSSVTVVVPAARSDVLVEDMLPAGLDPVDSNLAGANREAIRLMMESQTNEKSLDDERRIALESPYFYPIVFVHEETMDDRKFWSADDVPAGVYHFRHVVKALTPGRFVCAGAHAFEMYHPEVMGRGPSRIIEIGE